MTHPDHEEIIRTYLYCDGYQYADIIAQKIVEVFEMSSKLMSKQQHYDWGLRAIKSVISSCQTAIKEYNITYKKSHNLSITEELGVVIKTLKMDILSKLTYLDTLKFNEIINNIFKDIPSENVENELLRKAILDCYGELNLVINERQVNKCLEFYKQLKQRMGVAIIGPPSSGKSTIIEIVSKALTKINQKIKTYPVNPKSMHRQLLLGYTDHLNQWNDGVLTSYSLRVSAESKDVWSWIICDGDIDPEWVESLNSVLDDNRLMTLPSGWRIHFGSNVNFVFETHSVKNASPATISRIGIVYLSLEDVNMSNYLKSTLNSLPDDQRFNLEPLYNDYFLKAINWILSNGETTLTRSNISIAKTGFFSVKNVKTKAHFIVALINGLGPQLKQEFREQFATQVFEWADEAIPSQILRLYYNEEKEMIDIYHTNSKIDIDYFENGIPLLKTGQVLQYLGMLKILLTENNLEHFLLVGPHGSAKRLMVNYVLNERSDVELITINCSSNLSTNFVIQQIQQVCISVSTFRGTILKPKKGRVVLYFRNLHLVKPDIWGSNTTIDFLSQLIEYKGFFNQKTEFVRVQNITIIGTLLPTYKISCRFLSKLHLVNIDLPEKEDLSVITVAYLTAILRTAFPSIHFSKTKIVKMALTMIAVLEKAKNMFLSLNQNFYALSPHDLIQWCTNLKYYDISETQDPELGLLEVVCYEAIKIFTDRLKNLNEKTKFNNEIDEIFKINWNTDHLTQQVLNNYYVSKNKLSTGKSIFEKYSKEDWQSCVEHGIVEFGKENQELNIIINDEILILSSAVMRAALISEYNLLLIGKSGIGRKTAIKIVSALLSTRIIHPTSDSFPFFHNDLKLAIQYSGVECEDVFLVLEDYVFSTEQNTNLINLLMTSGEVSDLYSEIEMESLLKGIKEKWDTQNLDEAPIHFFAKNIKKHLHIFVILIQDNFNLKEIFLSCPAFSQNSGLIWLDKWNENTFKLFPSRLVSLLSEDDDVESPKSFENIFKSLPSATPSRCISMIKLYCSIYKEKKMSILSNIAKLKSGVSKLTAAKQLVSELKEKAAEQQEKLAEKQLKANAALDMISNTINGANTHKEEMEILKRKTEEENIQLVKRKAEIESELAEVAPLIKEAGAAIGNIKTESLSEIRSLRAPPEIIRDILEGVLKLMGTQDTSWNSMKTFLAKRGVKEEIRSFDASRILTENREAVEKLMATKKDSFDLKIAKRASIAAAPLATWVEANVKYSKVLDKIRPLEREQRKLKQNLDNAKTQLGDLNVSLLDVDDTVVKLKEQLSLYTKEAAEIEIGLNQVQETLSSAEALVNKLEDEFERWQQQEGELSKQLEILPNNCVLGAAFITFLAEEPENKRREIVEKWYSELGIATFDFILFFSTEREQLHWEAEGLPNNKASQENAAIIKKGFLTPLIIDPTSTAVQWLKAHYGKNRQNFEYINYNSSKFNTVLEASIRFGKILLVEEMEEDFYTLLPLLRGEFIQQGERKMICISGRKIDYHSDFKIIICSRNEHILLPAELASYISILNFNVTYSGFVEQLLSAAITQEKPEIESRKKHVLQENEELQEKLHTLQNQLLDCLAGSNENILNDKNLVITLNDTKTSFKAVSEAITESKKIQNKLRQEYEVYLNISSFGSKLYMACKEFAKYDIIYSLSANSFSKIFLLCIKTVQLPDENNDSSERQLFQSVYNYMSRGMFKSDRLLFFFHLVYRMFSDKIPENEMNVFLGNVVYQSKDSADLPSWLPMRSETNMRILKASLPDLYNKCEFNEKNMWSEFMASSQCEKDFLSFCKLSEFQKLLIIKSLRPDKLVSAIEYCVLQISGLRTIDPPVLSIQHTFSDSNAMEPILLITRSGMDPSIEIRDLAKQVNTGYEEIAMGEGQEAKALVNLEECKKNGKWLILKNLHLVTNWLPSLFQNLKHTDCADSFRLWLISEPTENFNAVLAQNCLKIAYEEPEGIGNNMLRIYASLGEKYENKLSRTASKIFFIFSCLHALLQERRNYIPQGWTKYYEFNHTDIQTCLTLTEDLWNIETSQVKWMFIKGLINEAVYSGRIENIEDVAILEAYLNMYFKDEVLGHKWKPLGLNINISNITQNKEYINVIRQFPKKDEPSMFRLPENINKAREKQISLKVISGLKGFYQKQHIEIANKDTDFYNLNHYFNLWKKINQGLDFIRLTLSKEFTGSSAIERFIHEEYVLGISLIQEIHKCFAGLKKILKGALEPDDGDVLMAKCILQYQTPSQWLYVWNGPKDPTQFLQELLQKTSYISTWQSNPNMIKKPIKLSLFFYPETFLACFKQDFSRTTDTSLENLVLRTQWKHSNKDGIILSDLLIEGALFEHDTITQCKSDTESINLVPNCYLYWTKKEKMGNENSECIEFPLYTNSSRECKVTSLQVECNINEKQEWILNGLAFYLKY